MSIGLRILALNDKLSSGGSVKRYNRLIKALLCKGHEVYYIAPLPFKEMIGYNKFHYYRTFRLNIVPRIMVFLFVSSLVPLIRVIKNNELNAAVVFNSLHAFPILVLRKLLKKKFKLIVSPREDVIYVTNLKLVSLKAYKFLFIPYVALLAQMEKIALKEADLLIFPSYFLKERLIMKYKLPNDCLKYAVIHNAINQEWLDLGSTIIKNECTEPVIGYVGRLTKIKGIPDLILAFSKVLYKVPQAKLFIIGDGPEKGSLVNLATKLGCQRKIIWTGWVDDVFNYMKRIDILVIPSIFESFPNVALEGLGLDKIVIGASVGGIVELLKHEELLYEPGDAYDLYSKILNILINRNYYDYLKLLCKKRKHAFLFDWEEAFIASIEFSSKT